MQKTRKAVKYIIKIEREDGKPMHEFYDHILSSFQADSHLTREYYRSLKDSLRAIEEFEMDQLIKKEKVNG